MRFLLGILYVDFFVQPIFEDDEDASNIDDVKNWRQG